ncbi:hypothetical protein RCL1_001700 [Eukaryota sp. TZLM3-RCL]
MLTSNVGGNYYQDLIKNFNHRLRGYPKLNLPFLSLPFLHPRSTHFPKCTINTIEEDPFFDEDIRFSNDLWWPLNENEHVSPFSSSIEVFPEFHISKYCTIELLEESPQVQPLNKQPNTLLPVSISFLNSEIPNLVSDFDTVECLGVDDDTTLSLFPSLIPIFNEQDVCNLECLRSDQKERLLEFTDVQVDSINYCQDDCFLLTLSHVDKHCEHVNTSTEEAVLNTCDDVSFLEFNELEECFLVSSVDPHHSYTFPFVHTQSLLKFSNPLDTNEHCCGLDKSRFEFALSESKEKDLSYSTSPFQLIPLPIFPDPCAYTRFENDYAQIRSSVLMSIEVYCRKLMGALGNTVDHRAVIFASLDSCRPDACGSKDVHVDTAIDIVNFEPVLIDSSIVTNEDLIHVSTDETSFDYNALTPFSSPSPIPAVDNGHQNGRTSCESPLRLSENFENIEHCENFNVINHQIPSIEVQKESQSVSPSDDVLFVTSELAKPALPPYHRISPPATLQSTDDSLFHTLNLSGGIGHKSQLAPAFNYNDGGHGLSLYYFSLIEHLEQDLKGSDLFEPVFNNNVQHFPSFVTQVEPPANHKSCTQVQSTRTTALSNALDSFMMMRCPQIGLTVPSESSDVEQEVAESIPISTPNLASQIEAISLKNFCIMVVSAYSIQSEVKLIQLFSQHLSVVLLTQRQSFWKYCTELFNLKISFFNESQPLIDEQTLLVFDHNTKFEPKFSRFTKSIRLVSSPPSGYPGVTHCICLEDEKAKYFSLSRSANFLSVLHNTKTQIFDAIFPLFSEVVSLGLFPNVSSSNYSSYCKINPSVFKSLLDSLLTGNSNDDNQEIVIKAVTLLYTTRCVLDFLDNDIVDTSLQYVNTTVDLIELFSDQIHHMRTLLNLLSTHYDSFYEQIKNYLRDNSFTKVLIISKSKVAVPVLTTALKGNSTVDVVALKEVGNVSFNNYECLVFFSETVFDQWVSSQSFNQSNLETNLSVMIFTNGGFSHGNYKLNTEELEKFFHNNNVQFQYDQIIDLNISIKNDYPTNPERINEVQPRNRVQLKNMTNDLLGFVPRKDKLTFSAKGGEKQKDGMVQSRLVWKKRP